MKKKPTKKIAKKTTKKVVKNKKARTTKSKTDGYVMFREDENDKNTIIISNMPNPMKMNDEEKKEFSRNIGMITGKLSKFMLEMGGMDVSYKINGEDINDIRKMEELDIRQKIELAIKEERYEDAQILKNILDKKGEANISFKNVEPKIEYNENNKAQLHLDFLIEFIENCRGLIVSKKTAKDLEKACVGFFKTEYRDLGTYNSLVLKSLNNKNRPVGEEIFVIIKK